MSYAWFGTVNIFLFLQFVVWDKMLCIENIAPVIDGHAFDVCTVLWLFLSHLFSSHKKKTFPLNNTPFHSLSPCSKISWFPVSDKLGETPITLINQKTHLRVRIFYSKSNYDTCFTKSNLSHHLYLLSNSRFLLYSVGNSNAFRLYWSKNKNKKQVCFWYEKHLCLSLEDF